ncbi:translation initiation factor IF-2-like [Onychomys torridus]|uniref:translation initiation factor IF-2-like n=1 Tax=Onychomys torridus TaxID=38674 RepID=UPI00167F8586|nr:translation initiation factor IF-2-like [Onychomys torridus]
MVRTAREENARKPGAPDALTLAERAGGNPPWSPRQEAEGRAARSPARPLPNFRARPAPRPTRSPPCPARALPTCAAAGSLRDGSPSLRGRRAELVGGSGSLGGDRLSTRQRRLSRLPPPRRCAGLRDLPVPPGPSRSLPLGRLPAAPQPRLRLLPSEPSTGHPAPGKRLDRVPNQRASQRAAPCPRTTTTTTTPGSVEKARPESLWDTAESWILSS